MTVALTGLMAFAVATSAQDAKEGNRGNRGAAAIQQRVDRLSEELKLTTDQKTKITALYEAQGKKMQGMRDLTPEQRREKAREMREEMTTKMKGILTADQSKKWEQLRPQRTPGGERKGEGKGKGEGKKNK
ncbi:MAG TPA: Spy/CpxP family protein refolding chaperone [Clostridia bacterium]|nr:Spy/CpxP family protein refolding chaperone [Clostridia bacterium]